MIVIGDGLSKILYDLVALGLKTKQNKTTTTVSDLVHVLDLAIVRTHQLKIFILKVECN